MQILNRLTLKSLRLNKKRTAVTIIGILLATAMITTVSILVNSARASLIAYEIENEGKFHYAFSCEDAGDLKYIRENRKVESWYIIQNQGYAMLEGSKNEDKPYLRVLALNDSAMTDAPLTLVEGRMPQSESELVISKHIRSNGGVDYGVGDTITLDVGTRQLAESDAIKEGLFTPNKEEIVETTSKKYTIVGMVERPPMQIERYDEAGYSVFTYMDDVELNMPTDVYVYYNKAGLENPEQVSSEMEAACGSICDVNGELINYQSLSFGEATMNLLVSVAAVIIMIIMVTSIFCIRNSFAISITEKMKQYGMMASIGATSKQIRKNVLFEAGVLAAVGIPLGVASGIGATAILIYICNSLLAEGGMIHLVFSVSVTPILVAVVLSYVTILISAGRSARRASRVSPLEAIRGNGELKITAGGVRTPKWIKRYFHVGGDMAYKNLRVSRKKYRTTIISIVVSVSLFIGMWYFMDAAFRTVGMYYTDYSYNFAVLMPDGAELPQQMKQTLLNSEEVENYALLQEKNMTISGKDVILTPESMEFYEDEASMKEDFDVLLVSLSEEEYKRYLEKVGISEKEADGKGILVSTTTVLMEKSNGKTVREKIRWLGYEKGDVIPGWIAKEDWSDEPEKIKDIQLELAEVSDEIPMGMENESDFVIVSEKTFANLVGSEPEIRHGFYGEVKDTDKLETMLMTEFDTEEIYVHNYDASIREERAAYIIIAIFLYGFIAVISLIGVTNIFNTITTNMELRSREFAMLKSIGMTKKEFTRMIHLESIFYGAKSLLIGVPIGILLSLAFHNAFGEGAEFAYQIPVGGIVIAAAAVTFLIFGIMRYSMNRINRQNIIETIRDENI